MHSIQESHRQVGKDRLNANIVHLYSFRLSIISVSIYTLSSYAENVIFSSGITPLIPLSSRLQVEAQQVVPWPYLAALEPSPLGQVLSSDQVRTGLYVSKTLTKVSLWRHLCLVVQGIRCWT